VRIGLGTAQLGLDYGISNPDGKTPFEEAERILATAAREGIRIIDTAPSYGDSEQVLGEILPPQDGFHIVTKTPFFRRNRITEQDAELLEEMFRRSLQRLRVTSAYGLLAHHAEDLLAEGGDRLVERMQRLKEAGVVARIGASVYTAQQIDGLLERYDMGILQVPVNVLDQRLIASGHLARLKERGIEVHARSAFLQGLLLMEPDSLPPHFHGVRRHLRKFQREAKRRGLSPLQAAIGFLEGIPEIDVVIAGVNDHLQLEEICRAARPIPTEVFAGFAVSDPAILNPSEWRV
jgi:aryl-alcohol dehydrogenase-like predicted oxidoreductase